MDRGNAVHAYIEAITGGTDDKPTMGVVLHVQTGGRTSTTIPSFAQREPVHPDTSDAADAIEGCFPVLCIIVVLLVIIGIAKAC